MSKLQEVYIKKYISCKDFNIVMKTATSNFLDEFDSEDSIINKDVDLILYLMSKSEFLGLMRFSIILYNSINPVRIHYDDKCKLLSKKQIVEKYLECDSSFDLYLTASLYSYV